MTNNIVRVFVKLQKRAQYFLASLSLNSTFAGQQNTRLMNFNFLKTFLLSGAVALTTMTAFAGSVITTTVNKQANLSGSGNGDPEPVEKEEPKHRLPDRPIPCTIDIDYGIQFTGLETPDFILYEIYDTNGNCWGVFSDEDSFVEFLFTLSGEYQLRFTTPTYDLVGYVKL